MDNGTEQAPLRVIPFVETSRRLCTTTVTVKKLVKHGLLDEVKLPNRKRARGVTSDSLERFIRAATVRRGDGSEAAR